MAAVKKHPELDSFETFRSALRHAEEAKDSWYAAFINLRQMCIDTRVELALAFEHLTAAQQRIEEQNKTIKILAEQGETIPMRRTIESAPDDKVVLFFPVRDHTSCTIYPFCVGAVLKIARVVVLTDGTKWPLSTFSHWFDPETLPCR